MPRPSAPPSSRATLRDRAYDGVRDLLIGGPLAPGERLSVRELAASLDVSPMPVREAVHRLVAEHALEVRPQSAVRVPVMTKERFAELRTIRVALEGMAASRAATLVTPADLQRIRGHHERFRRAAQRDRPDCAIVIRANQQLHFEIYRSARMPTLFGLIESLWLQIGPVLNLDLRTSPKRLHTLAAHDHHAKLVTALERRDARGARTALVADIESAAAYVLSLHQLPNMETIL